MYFINRQKKKLCIVSFLVGLSFVVMTIISPNWWQFTSIEAHPTKSIVIDQGKQVAGEAIDYTLNKDATNLEEPVLKSDSKFSGYVQGDSISTGLTKERLIGVSTLKYGDLLRYPIQIGNGNIMLVDTKSAWASAGGGILWSGLKLIGPEVQTNNGIIRNNIRPIPPVVTQNSAINLSARAGVNQNLYITANSKVLVYDDQGNQLKENEIKYTPTKPVNHAYNRVSSGFDGTLYNIAFIDNKAADKSFYYPYVIDWSGETLRRLKFESVNKKYGVVEQGMTGADWYDGLDNSSFLEVDSGKYFSLTTLGRHSDGDTNRTRAVLWGSDGKIITSRLNSKMNGLQNFQKGISSTKEIYFMEYATNTTLQRLDVKSNTFKEVLSFPDETKLTFEKSDNGWAFYGYVESFTGVFEKYHQQYGEESSLVVGEMSLQSNGKYEVDYLNRIKSDVALNVNHLLPVGNDRLFVTAYFEGETSLVDAVLGGKWEEKLPPPYQRYNSLYGYLLQNKDYSPAIHPAGDMTINITDSSLTSAIKDGDGLTPLDRWLITGEKGGTYESEGAIKVYDTQEFDDSLGTGITQLEFNRTINRNPQNINGDIDWQALGFDKKVVGPQQVSYFIADRHQQQTVTSRWVNAKTDQTIIKDDSALDAHNFSLLITDNNQLTEQKVKKLAETLVWEVASHKIHENSKENLFSADVKVDVDQLEVIKKATIAKPYPLDIKYKGVTNRIWVFLTNANTTVKNGVALYADDFSLPLKEASNATGDKLLKKNKFKQTEPNVVVYDYVAQPQGINELTPLSSGKADGDSKGLSVEPDSLTKVNTATGSKTIPNFQFKYINPSDSKSTLVAVTVTIDDTPEFCFKLERTVNELKIVEPILDPSMNNKYKSIEIRVPLHIEMSNWDEIDIPTGWFKFKNSSTDDYHSYGYSIETENSLVAIEKFLNELRFSTNSQVDLQGEIQIIFRERVYTAYEHPDGTTHYYLFVKESLTWQEAYNNAKKERYKGLQGYLATTTSAEEHSFLFNNIAKNAGWLGGTRMIKTTGAKILDEDQIALNQANYNIALGTASKWYWVSGPEAGLVFYNTPTRNDTTGPVPGVYADWAHTFEPNNKWRDGEPEYILQFAKSGGKEWNDLFAHNLTPGWNDGYYVEFSEYGSHIESEYDEKDVFCDAAIPQKIYIKGKDDQGNALPTGDQVMETALRIGKVLPVTPIDIPWYDYVKLTKQDGTLITPDNVTVAEQKQDILAIYTRSLTKLHVRQVILNSKSALVEPRRGEGTLINTNTLGGVSQRTLPTVYPTREEALAGFKTVMYEVNVAKPYYLLEPIVPEYYQYEGYVLTDTNSAHNASAKQSGIPKWDIVLQPEVWLTIYLTPNDTGGKNPGLYGWYYGNDNGYTLNP